MTRDRLIKKIFQINNLTDFNELALEIFAYQYEYNKIYKTYIDACKFNIESINHYSQIPFLPIEFYKNHKITSSEDDFNDYFISSGTTSLNRSKHYIKDFSIYQQSLKKGFEYFYGKCDQYVFYALVPDVLTNKHSSLAYMLDVLITESRHPDSGFYFNKKDRLIQKLKQDAVRDRKIILIGLSYALLDVIDKEKISLPNLIVMETGGMKGRREEMIKKELHEKLSNGFGVETIHSEYGMTELFSQAYSKGNGIFNAPSWMKIIIRDKEDPFTILPTGTVGGINIIDFANIDTCSFIETQDLGKLYTNESFEVLGRMNASEIRGCNLMIK